MMFKMAFNIRRKHVIIWQGVRVCRGNMGFKVLVSAEIRWFYAFPIPHAIFWQV
jgi:hypothetical protein